VLQYRAWVGSVVRVEWSSLTTTLDSKRAHPAYLTSPFLAKVLVQEISFLFLLDFGHF
jgi:hypothetical protein